MMPQDHNLPLLPICVCGNPDCQITFGFCHCRCGSKTSWVIRSDRTKGLVKGEPRRFINGHQRKVRPMKENAKPFKIDGVYCRLIPISNGFYAIVDADDYDWLMESKWSLSKGRYTYYAYRHEYEGAKRVATIRMHRLIAHPGSSLQGDHLNGNGLDNRSANLRPANHSQQRYNSKLRTDNVTGYTGIAVCAQTGKYRVSLKVGGKELWLGRHLRLEDAVAVRRSAEERYIKGWTRKK